MKKERVFSVDETHTKSWDEGPYDPAKHKPWSFFDRLVAAFVVTIIVASVAQLFQAVVSAF